MGDPVVEYLSGINGLISRLRPMRREQDLHDVAVSVVAAQPRNRSAAIYLRDAEGQWTRRSQAGAEYPAVCPVDDLEQLRLLPPMHDFTTETLACPISIDARVSGALLIGAVEESTPAIRAVNATLANVIGGLNEAVSERESLYMALDDAPALIAMFEGPNLELTFSNRRFRELVVEAQPGAVVEEFLRNPDSAKTHRALLEHVAATGETYYARGIPFDVSFRPTFEGDVAYMDYSIQRLDRSGDGPALFLHAFDVTEGVRALEEILDVAPARGGMREVEVPVGVGRADDPVAVPGDVDLKTRQFTFVSRAAEAMTGYAPDEWTRDGFWERMIHPLDRRPIRDQTETRALTHDDFELDYRLVTRDGRVLTVHDLVHIARDESGRPVSMCGILIDVTERTLDRQEKQRMRDRLLEVQRLESLGVLAGGIAHDFNNLLTAVLGNTTLAKAQIGEQHQAAVRLDAAVAATRRAAELTHQLLAYSGKGAFTIEPVALNAFIAENMELLTTTLEGRVNLNTNLGDDVPSVEADRAQLGQLLLNLVMNGAEACVQGGGTVVVATSRDAADRVRLTVTDDGCGMDSETRAAIFEPFFTTKAPGRGLGMAAVQGIVRGLNGELRVESTKGRGTVVEVVLAASEVPVASGNAPRGNLLAGGTVLLVDDEEDVRVAGTFMLEHLGFEVVEAFDGLQGVRRFQERHSELSAVILDLTMPELSGREAFEEMHRIDPSVPIILSSGFDEEEAYRRFSPGGPAGFLKKPYTVDELREVLEAV